MTALPAHLGRPLGHTPQPGSRLAACLGGHSDSVSKSLPTDLLYAPQKQAHFNSPTIAHPDPFQDTTAPTPSSIEDDGYTPRSRSCHPLGCERPHVPPPVAKGLLPRSTTEESTISEETGRDGRGGRLLDLECISSLRLPRPFVLADLRSGRAPSASAKISDTISSLSLSESGCDSKAQRYPPAATLQAKHSLGDRDLDFAHRLTESQVLSQLPVPKTVSGRQLNDGVIEGEEVCKRKEKIKAEGTISPSLETAKPPKQHYTQIPDEQSNVPASEENYLTPPDDEDEGGAHSPPSGIILSVPRSIGVSASLLSRNNGTSSGSNTLLPPPPVPLELLRRSSSSTSEMSSLGETTLKPLTAIRISPVPVAPTRGVPISFRGGREAAEVPCSHTSGGEHSERWLDGIQDRETEADRSPTGCSGRFSEVGRRRESSQFPRSVGQSFNASTLRPDTLAHARQLVEYQAVLAQLGLGLNLTDDSNGSSESPSRYPYRPPPGDDKAPGLGVVCNGVDELGVEWCFFCGKENKREDLELVDLGSIGTAPEKRRGRRSSNPVGLEAIGRDRDGDLDQREELGGMQWVCEGQCD